MSLHGSKTPLAPCLGSFLPDTLSVRDPCFKTRPWPRLLSAYAITHGAWLVLYALLGKGFAYAGFAPFYVGELLLLLALLAVLGSGRLVALIRTPLGVIMLTFLLWQLACLLPYISTYGIDSLRDSAIWGYAVFAWVAAALVLRLPGFLRAVLSAFRRFLPFFLVLAPIAWLATLYLPDWLPKWPGTVVTLPMIKGGEFCVHLAGMLALLLQIARNARPWWIFLILADVILAMRVRGGLLAFIVASALAVLLRPRLDRFLVILGTGVLIVTTMAAFDIRFEAPAVGRELSLEQLDQSLRSVVSDSEMVHLEGTKRWRLMWWGVIWEYTVDGPYFWTGKGYGVNLADSDGFQVGSREEPLRSPHSSHLTFLARSGVPGFCLWISLQLTWAGLMLRSYQRARLLGAVEWEGLFAWLLAYWAAFIVAAAFDVFLEGPMAGIPFWSIFGLGWGGHVLFCSQLQPRVAKQTA